MAETQARIENNVLVVERKDRRGSLERREIPHMETEEKHLMDMARDALHEVAEKTMEFAHEVKEKIIGHVTDHDIEKAAERVAALKNKLMYEQHETREILVQAAIAQRAHNLEEYQLLKEKEIKLKLAERATEAKILEAASDYDRLKNAQLSQKMNDKLHQKCHEADRKAINADIAQHRYSLPGQ